MINLNNDIFCMNEKEFLFIEKLYTDGNFIKAYGNFTPGEFEYPIKIFHYSNRINWIRVDKIQIEGDSIFAKQIMRIIKLNKINDGIL